ncbi:hypothetical protein [Roseofilum casamattae]|uniref:Uncharacterized protein n=1 Tax=Roseofilum casamattae BLCC-M143 TaxID=3022442 RepID=A0ABT7BXP7_9CYAN|nr:hypothetical protein [Roseofilum casamattae]MDJ1183830.1 hypothetical protein [Roseofilum casamattae BLCC-M143]
MMNQEFPSMGSHSEWELVRDILLNEERIYLWNPLTVEAEAYFSQLEMKMEAETPEFVDRAGQGYELFYQHLDGLWENSTLAVSEGIDALRSQLDEQFKSIVPQHILANIATKIAELKSSSASLAEQMINCVQENLPEWDSEDLFVLARPFAYTMRGTEEEVALERVLQNAQTLDWETCSDVDRARLTLAIARYGIACRDR